MGDKERNCADLMQALGLSQRPTFRGNYLNPSVDSGWLKRANPIRLAARPSATGFLKMAGIGCKTGMNSKPIFERAEWFRIYFNGLDLKSNSVNSFYTGNIRRDCQLSRKSVFGLTITEENP